MRVARATRPSTASSASATAASATTGTHGRLPEGRLGDQRRDRAGEGGPGQRDQVGRAQVVAAVHAHAPGDGSGQRPTPQAAPTAQDGRRQPGHGREGGEQPGERGQAARESRPDRRPPDAPSRRCTRRRRCGGQRASLAFGSHATEVAWRPNPSGPVPTGWRCASPPTRRPAHPSSSTSCVAAPVRGTAADPRPRLRDRLDGALAGPAAARAAAVGAARPGRRPAGPGGDVPAAGGRRRRPGPARDPARTTSPGSTRTSWATPTW